jgi:hypothetical protein
VLKKWDDIARLEAAIMQSHGCCAIWHKTVRVHEVFRGQTVWSGKVEIFNLKGHPKAKRCFGCCIVTTKMTKVNGLSPCWKSRQSNPLQLPCGLANPVTNGKKWRMPSGNN